jgi:hypothetical protein
MRSLLQRHRFIILWLALLFWGVAAVFGQAPGTPGNVSVNAKPATPTISSLSTASGAVGATVVITGSGFSTTQGSGTVTFNGAVATASSWSALSITVTVPAAATTGNIVVTQNGMSSTGIAFLVNTPTTACGTLGCLYVDNSCGTAGNGSIDQCLSNGTGRMTNLQTAISAAVAGTTIVVHVGNADYVSTAGSGYTGASGFQFTSSGTSTNPIILRNATGERPVLRGCTSASTTVAACDRATITLHNQSYIKITSANCPTDISTQASLGLHIYGLVIAYDDGGATEDTYALGNEISCTEIERGYANLDDGNWSTVWLQAQNGATVRRNYLHDVTVETLTGEGSQSSRSAVKTFGGVNSTIASNTIVDVAYSSANQYGIGFDCKADCVGVIFEKNLVLNTPTGWRIENQESPGGPYTTNGATGSTIRWNLFTSDGSAGVRECMHFEDGKITDVTFHNNTCSGYNEGLGENNHPSANVCQGITSYNNAFYATIDTNIKLSDGVGTSCTFALSNFNRYTTAAAAPRFRYNATNYTALADWQATGFDANSTEGTDVSFLFTNAAAGDYTLQASSPLQGTGSSGVDIGAYTDSVTILGCNCGVSTSTPLSSYYVRPDGNNANAGTSNTAGGAWLTIDKCADTLVAGEVCRVQTGTYNEIITPANSGTSGNTITIVAEGTVNVCGLDIAGKSYLRYVALGLKEGAGCSSRNGGIVQMTGTNTGLEFWHNTVSEGIGNGINHVALNDRCNKCIAIGNHVTAQDHPADTIGALQFKGTNVYIGYNEIDNIDADGIYGNWINARVVNNYYHDVTCSGGAHSDFFQTDAHDLGLSNVLFEANLHPGQGNCSDEHVGVIQNLSASQCATSCGAYDNQLWRRNVWLNNSTSLGISPGTQGTQNRIYYVHNTEVDLCRHSALATTPYCTNFRAGVNFVYAKNNVGQDAWGASISNNIEVFRFEVVSTFGLAYNLGYSAAGSETFHSQWTSQTGPQSNVNPNFVSKTGSNPLAWDVHLGAGSGDGLAARGTGGPLTTTSGSGTGTTFNVAANTGGFFRGPMTGLDQYSGNLTPGDTITVGTDVVTVVSVSSDAITVTPSFTWASGENVYWGSDTTPDMGAYPYKAGGYTLSATYVNAGGTVTVTPNDASLVRFVVCYGDGVPYEVDNATPFTCTSPTGTLMVRVYPLYASSALWAVAVP